MAVTYVGADVNTIIEAYVGRVQVITRLSEALLVLYNDVILDECLSEDGWHRKCHFDFGMYLYDPRERGGFSTWKEYYRYLHLSLRSEAKLYRVGFSRMNKDAMFTLGDIVMLEDDTPGHLRQTLACEVIGHGSCLNEILKNKLPLTQTLLVHHPLSYYQQFGYALPFCASELGLNFTEDDVQQLTDKSIWLSYVVFRHCNIHYVIMVNKPGDVARFNQTVYVSTLTNTIGAELYHLRYLYRQIRDEYHITPQQMFALMP